jgi:RimJ/RimL family protein N-acetyltransferase
MQDGHAAILENKRLRLVDFTTAHLDDFAAMNADPDVVAFFPATLTHHQSAARLQRIIVHGEEYGFSLFAVHLKSDNRFVGFTGCLHVNFDAHFTPAVEIGWRFPKSALGAGPRAGGRARLPHLWFYDLGFEEIVSFTAAPNKRSIRVMEKIGMQHDAADDFDHPNLAAHDPLCRHVLYRLRSPL